MKKALAFALLGVLALATVVLAAEKATTDEVYEMCTKAASMLEQLGPKGLAAFDDPKGEFVWKDSYVFILDCKSMTLAAHPDKRFVGMDATKIVDMKTKAPILKDACEKVTDKGLWKSYAWKKPGSEEIARKVSFNIPVKGSQYVVGAGIWDENVDVDKLNGALK